MIAVIAGLLAVLSSALHCYIWILESFWWTGRARFVFRISRQHAEATRELAFSQGFYNLFLALIALVGVLFLASQPLLGAALMLAGTGSMLAAAVVLVASNPARLRPAFTQGLLPLLTVIATVASLLA